MRKKLAVILAVSMVAALFAVPGTATAKPKTVGEDPAGDWGSNQDPALAPIGDLLGQDLVGASIQMVDKQNVNFIIHLNSLPPIGGVPEISRYVWNFDVDGEHRELDGKFTNYSRGACDPTSGQCPPPRDPGMAPFLLRGNCGVTETPAISLTTCEELANVEAAFDTAEATITVPLTLEALGAKPGSKITPAPNLFGGSIAATQAAFITNGTMPMDTMVVTKDFVVPSGKKAKKPKKKKR